MTRLIVTVMLTVLTASCATLQQRPERRDALPVPTVTKHVRTVAGSIMLKKIDANSRSIHYVMGYVFTPPTTEPLLLKFEFEDPPNPRRPILSEMKIPAGRERVRIESPRLSGIQAGGIHTVILRAYSETSGRLRFEHSQDVLFVMPRRMPS